MQIRVWCHWTCMPLSFSCNAIAILVQLIEYWEYCYSCFKAGKSCNHRLGNIFGISKTFCFKIYTFFVAFCVMSHFTRFFPLHYGLLGTVRCLPICQLYDLEDHSYPLDPDWQLDYRNLKYTATGKTWLHRCWTKDNILLGPWYLDSIKQSSQ